MNTTTRNDRRDYPPEPPVIAGRVPPHDLDAEASVLADLLLSPVNLGKVAHFLRPEHFYSEPNRLIYEAITEVERMGMQVDVSTVAHHLRAEGTLQRVDVTYLGRILDATPAVANVATHAMIVFEVWRARRMIAACHKHAALGYQVHAAHVAEYLDGVQDDVFGIGFDPGRSSLVKLGDALAEVTKRIQHDGPSVDLHGLPTGFPDLDDVPVRFARGNVTFVGARPAMGKTAFMMNLAINSASFTPEQIGAPEPSAVGVFSLEQPTDQLVLRTACMVGGANLANIVSGKATEMDRRHVIDGASRIERLPVWFDDTAGLSLAALRAKCRLIALKATAEGAELRVVFVDYIQLMSGRRVKGQSREQELSEISRGLKQLAKEMRLHVVVLTQLNRRVETRNPPIPLMSDLRESGSFEQDADSILLLYRPEYYAQKRAHFELDPRDKGAAQVIIGKNRHGPEGAIRLAWLAACCRFSTISQRASDAA